MNFKMKKKWIYIILIISILVLYFTLKNEFFLIMDIIVNAKFGYMLCAGVLIFIYLFTDAITLKLLVNDEKNNFTLNRSFRNVLITAFFNAITPFSSGGQPAQIYLLSKEKIGIEKATSISIQNFIVYQFVLVLIGFFAFIYQFNYNLFGSIEFLSRLTFFGFSINLFIILFLISITLFPKFNIKIVHFITNVLYNFHFIKNKDEKRLIWEEKINVFYSYSRKLRKNLKLTLKLFFINIIKLLAFYSIPVFLFYSIGIFDINPIKIIVASAYVLLITSFIPIPGASGGAEYSFIRFFGVFIISNKLAAIMLLWRFITYYIPLFVGMCVFGLTNNDTHLKEKMVNKEGKLKYEKL